MKFNASRTYRGYCWAGLTIKVAFALALIVLTQAQAQEQILGQNSRLDIYTGTLQQEAGQLVLNRCDAVGNRYLLDADGGIDALLEQLPAEVRDGVAPVTVSVIGRYSLQEQQNHLNVQEFTDIQPGKSCHLLDLLDRMQAADPPSVGSSGNNN